MVVQIQYKTLVRHDFPHLPRCHHPSSSLSITQESPIQAVLWYPLAAVFQLNCEGTNQIAAETRPRIQDPPVLIFDHPRTTHTRPFRFQLARIAVIGLTPGELDFPAK